MKPHMKKRKNFKVCDVINLPRLRDIKLVLSGKSCRECQYFNYSFY